MKTPQEIMAGIARLRAHPSWNDPKTPCACWLCPLLRTALAEINEAIAAAREEGRKAGIEAAASACLDAADVFERRYNDTDTGLTCLWKQRDVAYSLANRIRGLLKT